MELLKKCVVSKLPLLFSHLATSTGWDLRCIPTNQPTNVSKISEPFLIVVFPTEICWSKLSWGSEWFLGCTLFHKRHKYTFSIRTRQFLLKLGVLILKWPKFQNFTHTLPLVYAFKSIFRMSSFISNNLMIRNFASSWVTFPDGRKSEPNCSYKVGSYIKTIHHARETKGVFLTHLVFFMY